MHMLWAAQCHRAFCVLTQRPLHMVKHHMLAIREGMHRSAPILELISAALSVLECCPALLQPTKLHFCCSYSFNGFASVARPLINFPGQEKISVLANSVALVLWLLQQSCQVRCRLPVHRYNGPNTQPAIS